MFMVERLHYVPMDDSGQIDYTPSIYNVQGRTNALHPLKMFRVELIPYVPMEDLGKMNALHPY